MPFTFRCRSQVCTLSERMPQVCDSREALNARFWRNREDLMNDTRIQT